MGDGSDKIPGVKGLGDKKLPKMFPELLGEQSFTLDDLFEICEAKHDQHVIYSRIIFDFEKLENNHKVMDLGNPMLDDLEKEFILDIIKKPPFKLNMAEFIRLYNQDGLGNILKNVEYWLRENWDKIDRYSRSKQ